MSTLTVEELGKKIRHIEWRLTTEIPHDLTTTNHARRLASLRRQRVELQAELSHLVTELGSAVQEGR